VKAKFACCVKSAQAICEWCSQDNAAENSKLRDFRFLRRCG